MHALSSSMSTKMPGRPSSATTSTANSTIGSVMRGEHQGSHAAAKGSGRRGLAVGSAAMAVPLFDTATPLEPLRADCATAAAVLESGRYILGPEVEAFEAELAAYLGVRHVIGVANGTDALTSPCARWGSGPGDEVVVPSFTFYASAEAIPPTGARPVFCDVDPDTFCATPETVRAALTPHTKAVIAVAPVRQRRAGGRDRGAGACRCWRTPPRPRGALCTAAARPRSAPRPRSRSSPPRTSAASATAERSPRADAALAETARMLRFHGSRDKATYELVGYNSRLDELQAALLRVLLPELDGWAAGRRVAAARYEQAGAGRLRRAAGPGAGRRRPGTCTSCAIARRRAWRRRWGAWASARAATTACRCIASRRCASTPGASAARHRRARRARIWRIPISPVLGRDPGDRGRFRYSQRSRVAPARPCASGSTSPTLRTCWCWRR